MVQIQNLNKIINFLRKSLRNRKINSTFALANGKLGYGVMVTLQILVLSFQVRILVAQHEDDFFKSSFFSCCATRIRSACRASADLSAVVKCAVLLAQLWNIV